MSLSALQIYYYYYTVCTISTPWGAFQPGVTWRSKTVWPTMTVASYRVPISAFSVLSKFCSTRCIVVLLYELFCCCCYMKQIKCKLESQFVELCTWSLVCFLVNIITSFFSVKFVRGVSFTTFWVRYPIVYIWKYMDRLKDDLGYVAMFICAPISYWTKNIDINLETLHHEMHCYNTFWSWSWGCNFQSFFGSASRDIISWCDISYSRAGLFHFDVNNLNPLYVFSCSCVPHREGGFGGSLHNRCVSRRNQCLVALRWWYRQAREGGPGHQASNNMYTILALLS